jgi:hypothetical protein
MWNKKMIDISGTKSPTKKMNWENVANKSTQENNTSEIQMYSK